MTRFQITQELYAQIYSAANIVTEHCQYADIWFIDKASKTISKEKTTDSIKVPTGFQIGDIIKTLLPEEANKVAMFSAYNTMMSYMYPEAELYELQLLTLAHMFEYFPAKLGLDPDAPELPEDDPFLEQNKG